MSDDETWIVTGKKWTVLDKSEFAQVIFHDVQEWYPTDGDIKCSYVLSEKIIRNNYDRVGLYRIGWNDPSEYITHETVGKSNKDSSAEDTYSVLFPVKNLPKDDGEFYQFCYLTNNDQIKGASTPFKFQRPRDEDLVEIIEESDDDLMVVCSRTAVMDDKLRKANEENVNILKEKLEIEKELNKLKSYLHQAQQKYDICEKEVERLRANFVSAENVMRKKEFIHEQEIKDIKLKYATETATYYKVLSKLKEVKEDLEEQLSNNQGNKATDKELQKARNLLQEEQKKHKKTIDSLEHYKNEFSKNQLMLSNYKDMLVASENSKVMILDEKNALDEMKLKLSNDLESLQSQSYSYKQELSRERKNNQMTEKNLIVTREMNEFYESKTKALEHKLKETEGNLMVARDMNECFEGKVKALEQKVKDQEAKLIARDAEKDKLVEELEEKQVLCQDFRNIQEELFEEVKELKAKLLEGASQYEAKYLECVKLQKKLNKFIGTNQNSHDKEKRSSMCKSISSFSHMGSLTPAQQTLSAAMSTGHFGNKEESADEFFESVENLDIQDREVKKDPSPPVSNSVIFSLSQTDWSDFSLSGNINDSCQIEDASTNESLLPCPVCNKDNTKLSKHLIEEHGCKLCPMCGLIFTDEQSFDFIDAHVQSHF